MKNYKDCQFLLVHFFFFFFFFFFFLTLPSLFFVSLISFFLLGMNRDEANVCKSQIGFLSFLARPLYQVSLFGFILCFYPLSHIVLGICSTQPWL